MDNDDEDRADQVERLLCELDEANAEIARLKAALEAERAACLWYRRRHTQDFIGCTNGISQTADGRYYGEDNRCDQCKAHDARRSAERAAQKNGR